MRNGWRIPVASARPLRLAGHDVTVVDSGDIMEKPRGLLHAVIDRLMQEGQPPILLMVHQMRDLVNLRIRMHPDISENIGSVIHDIKALDPRITGGGRGAQGQIGQGACLVPPSVAESLGITEGKTMDRPAPQRAR